MPGDVLDGGSLVRRAHPEDNIDRNVSIYR